ncbi:hypothetical protein [Sphingosinithalassobacter portus]|uniref:hypothetical protein n=1 Tax=Stakelama portus TaxID=2676234 RepID=UPI000D6E3E31|nr:hypothetical protein [Sphingosinithalassobacter portus]
MIRELLQTASRQQLLSYLAGAIHGFTIMARDPDLDADSKASINNRIHYLAGHLRDLIDPDEAFSALRLDGVVENVAALNSALARNLAAHLFE